MNGEHIVDHHEMNDEDLANFYRDNRDLELRLSDWTQLPDVNQQTRDAYLTYRQALRDLPTHANWPHLNPEDWPVKPE